MPFYGKTPDEAAQQLSRWLAIVHGQTAVRRAPARRHYPDSRATPELIPVISRVRHFLAWSGSTIVTHARTIRGALSPSSF